MTSDNSKYLRVIIYINVKLISLRFLLRKDILNHHNINLIFFFNHSIICFILNIYLDNHQNTLKYLKNTEINLNNVLIIIEDFDIRDSNWDPSYPHHLLYTDMLWEVADSFGLELLISINLVFIWYIDNFQGSNSVLDLIFLRIGLEKLNNYIILPNFQSLLDYASLLVSIILKKEFI